MSAQLFPLAPGVSVAGRLDRADIDALAAAGVRTIINNRPDGEDPGQLAAAEARRIAEAHGIAYHHIPITAATLSRADVDAFAAALRDAPAPVVAHCRSGVRSGKAVDFLRKAGFRKVKNLKGGILAWSDQVDPSQPKY